MMISILTFCIRQWVLMLVGALALGVGGIYALWNLPIDAFPDVTNIQVQVVTKAEGLSPVEVENLITYPIEIQISGISGLREIRSLSNFGLSQVTIVFEDDTDIYFARQLVLERLIEVKDQLPVGVEPTMAPVTTGLGEVYQYYLERSPDNQEISLNREEELTLMRTVQDWIIRPILKGLPGVIDVNALGGFVKQYQVLIHPDLLRKYELSLREVFDAIRKNNSNAGGNILERGSEKIIVRGVGLIKDLQDIQDIVVKEVQGTPVFVRDVGEVQIGHAIRHGAAVLNGEREVVAGVVLMLRGANARKVVNFVKQKVEEIHESNLLPAGIRIKPFYDRTALINAALTTVFKALAEGIFLVALVLFFFLGDVRSAFVVIGTLILTPLITFIVMKEVGLTANLMSLGGLAIGVGMIVDASVVVVENIYRYLCGSHPAHVSKTELIVRATREVGQPVIFGILIIILVFLPLLTLEGMEGKMFAPLAYTIMIALLVSLILSLVLSPVFCSLWVKGGEEKDTFVIRHAKRAYVPVLQWAITHPKTVLTSAVVLVAGTFFLIPFLGTIFMPVLEEGAMTPQTIRHPSISLEHSIEVEKKVHKALLEFPEVKRIVGKIGRSELANDPTEPHESDPIVDLIDRDAWTTAHTKEHLVEAMRGRIASIPGVSVLMSQPIQERVEELISGIRSEIGIRLPIR
jgi:cobalt-zinc-cadmium resistance protein CzcA